MTTEAISVKNKSTKNVEREVGITKHPPIAKITHPVFKGILPRTRLFRHLENSRDRPIIWIAGPPGSGKTTLVASYLESCRIPSLWYKVDEGDADIATFFYYMSLAVKKAAPQKRKPLPLLTPEYLQGITTFTKRYFENLFSLLKTPFIIVFDNYQQVSTESKFHEVISDGLSVIPEKINIIVMSRGSPPRQFVRLKANNKMSFLGWNEIRFTMEEVRELIRLKRLEGIDEEILFQIYKKTGSWAAGIVLILESLRVKKGRVEIHSLDKLSEKEISDYFESEIFERRDRETQEFLLKTAFFPRMTKQLAERLTGNRNSGQILSDLNENHYFIEMFHGEEPVYQFHTLFREFLLHKAEDSFAKDKISLIKHNVAILLEEYGQIEDAARLYRESHDFKGLARLAKKSAESLVTYGRSQMLLEWLDYLPEKVISDDPWLQYWKGFCNLPFNPDKSKVHFERTFLAFKKKRDVSGIFLSLSGIIESILYNYESLKLLDIWFSTVEETLKEFKGFPSRHIGVQVTCSMIRALALRRLPYFGVDEWVNRLLDIIHTSTDIHMKVIALIHMACYRYGEGDIQKLDIDLNSVEELMKRTDVSPLNQIVTYWLKAAYFNVTSKYDFCQKVVSDALKLTRTTGIHLLDILLMGHGVLSSLKAGDLTNVKKYLHKMSATLNLARPWQASFYHYTAAWEALYSGNLAMAITHSEQCLNLCEDVGDPWSLSLAYLLGAYVSDAFGEKRKVVDFINRARSIGIETRNMFTQFICLLTEAYFSLKEGKEAHAVEAIRRGMEIGKKNGYVNLYMWQPGVLETVLEKALEKEIEVNYVEGLIHSNAILPDPARAYLEHWPWRLKIYTFGRFGLVKDGKPFHFSGKVQHKPLLLLKALIALGGRDVSEEQLTDALWPEVEGDIAHNIFSTNLSRLRDLIDIEKAIKFQEGKTTLDSRYCWVDAWAFERIASYADIVWKEQHSKGKPTEDLHLVEKAVGMYRGHFLPADEEHFWTVSYRERLRSKFLRLITRLGDCLQQMGQWEKAVEYYQRGLDTDNLAEELYQNLMVCYQKLGQQALAIGVYNRCCKTLSSVLGVEPSSKTEAIYKSIRPENE